MEPHAKFDAFIRPVTVILKNDPKQPDYYQDTLSADFIVKL